MTRLVLLLVTLGLATPALSETYWSQISLRTTASKAPQVVAAADAFMGSEVGKTFPGRLMLMQVVAGDADAGTHTFVPIYNSAAERQAFVGKLQGNADWARFQGAMEKNSTPGGTVLLRNQKSWGDVNDTDTTWMAHSFRVTDPAKFVAAVDALMASPTGKKFPGQVYLSSVVAGGMRPVTHVISVGYASSTEMADWLTVRDASSDWANYNTASRAASEYQGATLSTNVKNWGKALGDVVVSPETGSGPGLALREPGPRRVAVADPGGPGPIDYPAGPMSDEPRRLTFQGRDGLPLVADALGDPAAAPVFLLHGGGQTRHAWGSTAQAVARSGFHAIAVDQRGHGESGWCDAADYTFDAFTDDVVALVRSQATPPVLVGASLGGIASLLAIGERGVAARGLVLVDIAARMERSGVQRILSFMSARPEGFASLEEAADAVAAYQPQRKRQRNLEGLAKNLRQGDDGRWRWHWDPSFMGSRGTGPDVAIQARLDDASRNLKVPTLLVRGRLSDLLSEEGARHFLDLVPHARFADVSGAGHMVAGDRNDVFSRAVLGFLQEDVAKSGAA